MEFAAFPGPGLGVKRQSFLCVAQCLVDIITSGETAWKIRKPDTEGFFRPGIFDNRHI